MEYWGKGSFAGFVSILFLNFPLFCLFSLLLQRNKILAIVLCWQTSFAVSVSSGYGLITLIVSVSIDQKHGILLI